MSRAPPWASSPAASQPAERLGRPLDTPPPTTAMGALVTHITGGADAKTFQPMNVNFGLFPPLDAARGGRKGRKERYKGYTDRAARGGRKGAERALQGVYGSGEGGFWGVAGAGGGAFGLIRLCACCHG